MDAPTSTFATTLLLEDRRDLLDIIDGSVPFEVYMCGWIIGQDGGQLMAPADLQSSPSRIRTCGEALL